MDELQGLLNEFGKLVEKDLEAMAADQGGELVIRIEELGLIFFSNAMAYVVNMGTSKENLIKVFNNCLDIVEEESKPKIIC